jgi:hypothetical protein
MSFDPYAYGQEIAADIIARYGSLNLPPEEEQDNGDIIQEFNKIAADMLSQEEGIEMPGANGAASLIPLDEKTIPQTQSLFAEGLYFATVKCAEMGIIGDIKKHLLQNLAMDVYSQAKQITASTYGQEHTPDFQFPFEQQVQYIRQTAESALIYYINEYEKQYGPIEVEEPSPELISRVEQTLAEEGIPLPDAPQPQQIAPAQAPQPSKPKGPTPHDKYGAVALLMTTLPADQRARILRNFNPEEKELIAFYSYPQHIEQNLDISCVEGHLKRFKEMMRQGGTGLKSAAYRGIARLAKSIPKEKLLSCVKDERPLVKQYLEAHYGGPHQTGASQEGASGNRHFSDLLPGRIEDILYRYLSKRLESAV